MDQIETLRVRMGVPEVSDALVGSLLEGAKAIILTRRYPFGDIPVDEQGVTILEPKYNEHQIRIALFLYNKMGAEGQVSHHENGISRTYEGADVPQSLLRGIVPTVGV